PALAQCRSEILLSEIGQKQAAPRTRETAWETSSRDPSVACDNSVSCRGLLALRFGFPSVVPDTPLAGFADQPVSGLFPVAVNFRKALGFSRTETGPPEGGHYIRLKISVARPGRSA